MTFGFTECAALAAWIVFVFAPLFGRRKDHKHQYSMASMMMWKLLGLIMGSLLVVTIYYFTSETLADSWQLILGFVMFVIHVLLYHMHCSMKHTKMYHENKNAYFWTYMILMVLTAIVFYVAMCVDGQGLYLVAVGCFSAYLLLFLVKNLYKHFYHHSSYANLKETGDSIMRRTPLLPSAMRK